MEEDLSDLVWEIAGQAITIGMGAYVYEYNGEWALLPAGQSFRAPSGVAVDSCDRVYVCQRQGTPVLVFDRQGVLLAEWPRRDGQLEDPHLIYVGPDDGIFVADQNVYVTDQIPRLSILNLDRELLARGRTYENGHNVYSDSHGDLYAVDVTNNRVQKFVKIH